MPEGKYGSYGGYGPGKSKGMAYAGTGPKPGVTSTLMKIGGKGFYGAADSTEVSGGWSNTMSKGNAAKRGINRKLGSSPSVIDS